MIVWWRQGHYVHTEIARMFWQILVDPAISMDAAITEKIIAEAGQPVLYVDCMGKLELSHQYLNWTQLIQWNDNLCASIVRKYKTQKPSQMAITDTSFRVNRGRVILIPARLLNSFWEVKCVNEKRTDSQVRHIRGVERDDGRRFVTPSWRAIAKYLLCQISRWQLKPCRSKFDALRKIICTYCKIVVGATIECTG